MYVQYFSPHTSNKDILHAACGTKWLVFTHRVPFMRLVFLQTPYIPLIIHQCRNVYTSFGLVPLHTHISTLDHTYTVVAYAWNKTMGEGWPSFKGAMQLHTPLIMHISAQGEREIDILLRSCTHKAQTTSAFFLLLFVRAV